MTILDFDDLTLDQQRAAINRLKQVFAEYLASLGGSATDPAAIPAGANGNANGNAGGDIGRIPPRTTRRR